MGSDPRIFRVIDTGVREGRRQIAFDQALIDAHRAGRIPDTIRFLRFPRTALVGRHQALSREIKVDYCRSRGIGIARRITGGGALYFDEGQLGWELVFHRATFGIATLPELARRICEAAAAGLSTLGVNARFRPRNDIEVDGRKVGGTGGFFDGDTLFYQGTVLVDLDASDMLAALNVPQPKLAKRALDSAAQRVVTLKELLGVAPSLAAVRKALLAGFAERLDISSVSGDITPREEKLADRHYDREIGTDEFVGEIDDPGAVAGALCGNCTGAGGTVTVYAVLEGARCDRIREVLFTGDFFVTPPRLVYDLEASLRHVPLAGAGEVIANFFAQADVDLISVSPQDFRAALEAAFASRKMAPATQPMYMDCR